MIDAGDIYLADLNDEQRRRVLVLSNARFTEHSGVALVVPELPGPPDVAAFPWRVPADGRTFAVDMLRTVPVDRLLERVDRAPAAAVAAARRALLQIA